MELKKFDILKADFWRSIIQGVRMGKEAVCLNPFRRLETFVL